MTGRPLTAPLIAGRPYARRLALAATVLAALAAPARAADPPFDPFAAISLGAPGVKLPAGEVLRDADGTRLAFRDLLGGPPLVLVPVDFDCRNVCGATAAILLAALDETGLVAGRDYRLLFLGIDPDDDPAAAARERARTHLIAPAPGARFAVPAPADRQALMDRLGIAVEKDAASGALAHPVAVGTVAADGMLARWLTGLSWDAGDLRLAIAEAGRGTVGGLADQVLLLCFPFDPATGRYTAVVLAASRVVGGLVVLSLAAFLGVLAFRRRGAGP